MAHWRSHVTVKGTRALRKPGTRTPKPEENSRAGEDVGNPPPSQLRGREALPQD